MMADRSVYQIHKVAYRSNGGETICTAGFGHYWWPYGHADQWVGPPAWCFLLVFYSNHSPKMHRFEQGAWDRETDGRTHHSIA